MSKKEKLKELITCSVCLDQFKDPKMLPCQHTFCLPCVRKFGFIQQKQQGLKEQSIKIKCAQCRAETTLPKDGYEYLPGNIYVQSLLDVFSSPSSSNLILSEDDDKRCGTCDTLCEVRYCEHCGKNYCPICEQRHLTELEQQLTAIQQQLVTAKAKLCHRVKLFMDECDQVKESVHIEIQNRVKQVLETESKLVRQIDEGVEKGKSIADDVQQKLDQSVEKISQLLKEDFDAASAKTAYQKILLFMEIHNTSSQFLKASEIIELGSLSFCPDTLSVIGMHSEGTDDVMPGEDYDLGEESIQENPASTNTESALSPESEDAHSLYYRSRPFIVRGRLGSAIVQRPCGIAVSPWAKKEIFVVSMDTHRIYVFDVDRRKLLRSFGRRGQGFGEFMCPSGIALSAVTREIYVTDKWKHCIHVFDEAENFVRQIGGKGSGEGQFRSPESISVDNNTGKIYVCDTINNRIQVLSKDGVFLREIDGQIPIPHHASHHHHYDRQIRRNLFQEPAGIAVTPDGSRLVVCDFANHRIHVFNTRDGLHLFTCGQKGSLRGQFNNPECVAVDSKGFIFVGDSGNSRVQILRPDGRFVRCFGNRGALPGHFNWISGLILTHTKEVVVSDFKNHCVQIF